MGVFATRDLNTERPVEVKDETVESKQVNPKRPHRAKQIKIMKIRTLVKDQCVNKGIYAEENEEFLRGEDVLRIHVKTWEALDLIQDVLDEVETAVPIARIALPFSMKNKFQKKGFICYLKVQDVFDVSLVQSIFSKHSEAFKKCDVALPTNKVPEKVVQVAKPVLPLFHPPTLARQSS